MSGWWWASSPRLSPALKNLIMPLRPEEGIRWTDESDKTSSKRRKGDNSWPMGKVLQVFSPTATKCAGRGEGVSPGDAAEPECDGRAGRSWGLEPPATRETLEAAVLLATGRNDVCYKGSNWSASWPCPALAVTGTPFTFANDPVAFDQGYAGVRTLRAMIHVTVQPTQREAHRLPALGQPRSKRASCWMPGPPRPASAEWWPCFPKMSSIPSSTNSPPTPDARRRPSASWRRQTTGPIQGVLRLVPKSHPLGKSCSLSGSSGCMGWLIFFSLPKFTFSLHQFRV